MATSSTILVKSTLFHAHLDILTQEKSSKVSDDLVHAHRAIMDFPNISTALLIEFAASRSATISL